MVSQNASSSSVVETTSEVCCDTSFLDNNDDQDNTEAQGEDKETKPTFSWTNEEHQKWFINTLEQALKREIDSCLTNKQENLDQNNKEDQEMDDNLDDVMIWAMNQKQSCKPPNISS